ncbi:MAG: energy transducer TonB [Bacteroidales bacterium]|nr:energy transducer TonB [Bacteroidales bacterium]
MSSLSHNNELFNDSGCLSQYAFEHYRNSMLSAEDLKLVEEHLDSCVLCKNALEGITDIDGTYDSISSYEEAGANSSELNLSVGEPSSSPSLNIYTNRINARLRSKFNYDPYRRRQARRGPFLRNFLIPAAASIIVLVGIIAYFHYFFPKKQELARMESNEIPVIMEEKETNIESITPAVPPLEKEQPVGGITTGESTIVADDIEISEEVEADLPLNEEIVEMVTVENEAFVAEEEFVAGQEVGIIIAEPKVIDEAVIVSQTEEMAGVGVSEEPSMTAKSRAKGDQKNAREELQFIVIEQMPEFPGGMDSLYRFLEKNISFPLTKDTSFHNTVITQFTVSKKGHIKDIEIIRSGGDEIDKEVVRVLKLMPDWMPGMNRGKAVPVKYTLPIHFESE